MPPKKKLDLLSDTSSTISSGIVSSAITSSADLCSPLGNSGSAMAWKASEKKSSGNSNIVLRSMATNDSDRLLLAQSIHNLVARGDAFVSALDTLQNLSKEKLLELDMNIETKKKEYQDLHLQLENQFKDTEIKMKQQLAENKLQAVKEILQSMDMTSIKNSLYEELTKNMDILKKDHQDQLMNVVKMEQEKGASILKQSLQNMELTHKANIAGLTAENESQKKEIIVLRDTIQNLKSELAEQRNLTRDIAQASSKSQISQNFGSNSK